MRPIDLENAEIKRSVRGYDIVETHKLLQKAAQEIATLNYEIKQLNGEIEKLQPLQGQASTLTDVILMAQKTAAEKAAKTQREAEKIISNARHEADHMLGDAHEKCEEIERQHRARMSDLKWHIERIAIEKDKMVGTYRNFLTEQLESIENGSRKYTTLAVVESGYDEAIPEVENPEEYHLEFGQVAEA